TRGNGPAAVVETVHYEEDARHPVLINPQSFPAHKPAGGMRIACFGGSSTYGYPFAPKGTFPNILAALLRAARPGRSVEVLNAGFRGGDSRRALMLMGELLRLDLDAIVVYSGHNEFLKFDYPSAWDLEPEFNPRVSLPPQLLLRALSHRSLLMRWVRASRPVTSALYRWNRWWSGHAYGRSGSLPTKVVEAV